MARSRRLLILTGDHGNDGHAWLLVPWVVVSFLFHVFKYKYTGSYFKFFSNTFHFINSHVLCIRKRIGKYLNISNTLGKSSSPLLCSPVVGRRPQHAASTSAYLATVSPLFLQVSSFPRVSRWWYNRLSRILVTYHAQVHFLLLTCSVTFLLPRCLFSGLICDV